jgi:ectoine hydroxylase-related dioxygenase (phytanoyl-CoA dioxygenase family)
LEEVAAYRPVIEAVTRRLNREARRLEERDTYGKAFLQTMQLRLHSRAAERFVLARRFGKIAAELLGVVGVRVYHDQSLFKEPGGGITPWHQDQYYWPLQGEAVIGMWMPLVDVDEAMGGMKFVAGSHRRGFMGQHHISDESQATYERLIAEGGWQVAAATPMQAGDATFHYGWTLHGAGPNRSDRMRAAMIVAMFADGTRVAAPTNPSQEEDRVLFLDSRAPGELAAGPLNPLVYHR